MPRTGKTCALLAFLMDESNQFLSPVARYLAGRDGEHRAGRKRISALRKPRRRISVPPRAPLRGNGRELAVSPAALYNLRRSSGGMDTDAAKDREELRA
ncbi:hypothetical protein [Mycolicibacterium rhodesiae]|uniref:hypothetical protein n=1 Tax=Mycolicibacterium rhodesiae TaxID=36814 RepID=UPI0013011C46|nr:hypothetical protein [Mycolicibacterium rhodesiae]